MHQILTDLIFLPFVGSLLLLLLKREQKIAIKTMGLLLSIMTFAISVILFVLFDVEVIFMYPWVVNFKQLGLLGFVEMSLFIGFLLVGYVYVVKKGALKWEA